ncbi:hypothetical protein BPAE_0092g00390 [Botrytis paeoniae]|uniref:Heterokaryon incompatibility domain-containing protein n=1 Tax=Botrytis paeoniae TaxID=278948 RepID=A0A4Z1FNB7_9HELO|nr:hypothetical protein BPAE_0092g00390 [Botrytis paeoniae]
MKVDIVGLESSLEIASSTGSDQSLKLSKQWLKNCNDSHDACRRRNSTVANILPTRLIEIGAEGPVVTLRLCLRKDVPINAVYFTLSHCWGKVSPKLVLLQSNEEHMLRGIDFLQLSKTFQDALWVVRQLGGQYIWIDSLCIVQDSKADWLRESARMCDVYSNSYCNICATAARNGNEGMFRDRNPLQVKQGWFRVDGKMICVGDQDAWEKEVNNGTLSSRAWVCQERLLSRRNLHFGSRQLFWECRQHSASETFSKGLPRKASSLHLKSQLPLLVDGSNNDQSNTSLETRAIWNLIVRMYMKCNLTYRADKLIAIGGLAATAHRTIGGRYLAGLWENHLPSGLLWATLDIPDPSKFAILGFETQEYIAPSWSWASLNAEIHFPLARRGTRDIEIYCQILEAHVDLTSDNLFGQLSGAYLKIKGELAPAHFYHKQVSLFSPNHESKSLSHFEKILYWDYEDMNALELTQSLYLLPVCKSTIQEDQWQIGGLLLVPTRKVDWEFRRGGMFSYSDDESHQHFESVCETFRKGFEDRKSSEWGRQEDGGFVLKML